MKNSIPILWLVLVCCSCKQQYFRAGSAAMEETIHVGENIVVEVTDKFERNNIVAFNYFGPDYSSTDAEHGGFKLHWEKRIYRMIAMSGDSVEINDGEVLVNDRHIPAPVSGKLLYKLETKGPVDEFPEDDYIMRPKKKQGDTLECIVQLTTEKAREYANRKPFFISVTRTLMPGPAALSNNTIFARPRDSGNWTIDNYGPFKIPSPGDKIMVDEDNWKFYHNIPGIHQGMNVINEKLYFLLGDSRYGAEDSRFIGLIAHSKMYGVVK